MDVNAFIKQIEDDIKELTALKELVQEYAERRVPLKKAQSTVSFEVNYEPAENDKPFKLSSRPSTLRRIGKKKAAMIKGIRKFHKGLISLNRQAKWFDTHYTSVSNIGTGYTYKDVRAANRKDVDAFLRS